MKDEKQTKKGFFSILRESFSKTGGCCCGSGETCGGPTPETDKPKPKETKPADKAARK